MIIRIHFFSSLKSQFSSVKFRAYKADFFGRGSERRISLLRLAIFFRTSKFLFSSSLLLHQNIESLFLVDHNYEIDQDQNIEIDKDHYYENQNVEKNEKNIESLSFV